MKFRPILFSTPMVLALLAGTKTQTRRKVKPSAYQKKYVLNTWPQEPTDQEWNEMAGTAAIAHLEMKEDCCPYGNVGDVLWVRETWSEVPDFGFVYRANDTGGLVYDGIVEKWKSSMFMPRHACRLFLEITDIRVERLQDISQADVLAEGIRIPMIDGKMVFKLGNDNSAMSFLPKGCWSDGAPPVPELTYYRAFWAELWSSINGRDSWNQNPFVWAVSFKVIDKPADFPIMEKPAQN